MHIYKEFSFEASHILPRHPGKCARLHGHSWKLTVWVEGAVDPATGFVMDYGDLKRIVENNLLIHLDHSHLGYGEADTYTDSFIWTPFFGNTFYPSSENLAQAIFAHLDKFITGVSNGVRLSSVTLNETCTSGASYARADYERDNPHATHGARRSYLGSYADSGVQPGLGNAECHPGAASKADPSGGKR
jgi:6-pyruvoyltetrahydropterin/6-carboxytetrahydropterin synthase